MHDAGILGIPNRTENWKTAKTFAPVITSGKQHKLAAWIIGNATGESCSLHQNEVCIELYWKGFRDYCKSRNITRKNEDFIDETATRYRRLFPRLREDIERYNSQVKLNEPTLITTAPHNYIVDDSRQSAKLLYINLLNTEIDVVLSAPGYLLIGEAKGGQAFGADSGLVLPHQLVREYVMASIVADMIDKEERQQIKTRVIPFVIGDNVSKFTQVKLLHHLHYLQPENVISWDRLSKFISERE